MRRVLSLVFLALISLFCFVHMVSFSVVASFCFGSLLVEVIVSIFVHVKCDFVFFSMIGFFRRSSIGLLFYSRSSGVTL